MELGSLPVPTGSHLWKHSFELLSAPGGWWWHITEPNEAIWGQISLQEVAPHITEFLWPHHLVLAGWLLCQQVSFARPKGKEADAHAKTATSQSNHLGPSCQLKLLQFQRGVILTFSLLLILIPSSFLPWHHLVGNPKTFIMEWECWKELRNHLSNSPFSPRSRPRPGSVH